MITRILVPHDGTEISDKALAKAFEFAGALDAEIILLHVIEQVPVPPTIMVGNDPVLIARTKTEITKIWMKNGKGWHKKKLLVIWTGKSPLRQSRLL